MMNSLPTVIGRLDSRVLRSLRRRIETELLTEIAAGAVGTSAMIRRIDVITAAGHELYQRDALIPIPPYLEVDQETVFENPNTLIRSQRSYRVF